MTNEAFVACITTPAGESRNVGEYPTCDAAVGAVKAAAAQAQRDWLASGGDPDRWTHWRVLFGGRDVIPGGNNWDGRE